MKTFTIRLKRSLYVFLLVSLYKMSLYAQNPDIIKGYYISIQGDSMVGEIHIGNISNQQLKFRAAESDDWKKLTPDNIKAAGGEGGVFIQSHDLTRQETVDRIFIQRLVTGAYNFYAGRDQSKKAVFFVSSKERPALVKVNEVAYVTQLQTYFGACATTAKEPQYSRNSLKRYLIKMNLCAEQEKKPVVYSRRSNVKFGVGLNLFYNSIKPTFEEANYRGGYFQGKYHKLQKTSIGISGKIEFIPSVSLQAGLNYVDKSMIMDSALIKLEYSRKYPIGYFPAENFYKYKLDLNLKYLELPVQLNYSLMPYSRWSPIINVGVAWEFPIVSKTEGEWGYPVFVPGDHNSIPLGEIGHLYPTDLATIKSHANFFGGIGARCRLKNQHEFSVKLEYFIQQEIYKVDTSNSKDIHLHAHTSHFRASINYFFYFKSHYKK